MEKQKFEGIHYLLAELPVWATGMILVALTQVPILIGRDILEGLPYNVAYSSAIGDVGFVIIALIAATILQRYNNLNLEYPKWLRGTEMHLLFFTANATLGFCVSELTLGSRSGQMMDIYHDVVIAPTFLTLAIFLLPVIFKNGTRMEKRATVLLIFLWVSLVGFDIKYDRMNQRQWLVKNINTILKMVNP